MSGLACREITLAETDDLTGFVMPGTGEIVWMDLDPGGRQRKYLVVPGDIVLAYRGTSGTLAKVGLVLETDGPAVAGQSLAVIRPVAVDGVWIFYWLARPVVRERLLAQAVGGRLRTLNLSIVRDLVFPVPTTEEVAAVHARHAEAVSLAGRIRTARAALLEVLGGMEGLWSDE